VRRAFLLSFLQDLLNREPKPRTDRKALSLVHDVVGQSISSFLKCSGFFAEAPVLRVDGVFRGVRIENQGEVDVRFWYRPPPWNLSVALCGVGVLLLLVSLCMSSGRGMASSS